MSVLKKYYFFVILISISFISCDSTKPPSVDTVICDTVILVPSSKVQLTVFELLLLKNGFVNILSIDSTIQCDIRYSSANNFVGIDMYHDFNSCYLQQDVALRLANVQKSIHAIDSNYSLLIFDGVRPLSVQKIMWDSCKYEARQKKNFLSHPTKTSPHNYGAAVDLSLTYKGTEVDMGTAFDFAGEAAYTYIESDLVLYGKITKEQLEHRLLLRNAMEQQGFIVNKYEWWHFGACYRSQVDSIYPLVVSFDSISAVKL